MSTKVKFKKGQWLIRIWDKSSGGETDVVKFKKKQDSEDFICLKFFRFKKDKLDYVEEEGLCQYEDERLSMQLRPATEEEIAKFANIIFNL